MTQRTLIRILMLNVYNSENNTDYLFQKLHILTLEKLYN